MKRKISCSAVCVFLGLFAFGANAAFSDFGYTLNENSHYLRGTDGLDWLQWNKTQGMTAEQALAIYEPLGWRLADYDDLKELFARGINSQFDTNLNEITRLAQAHTPGFDPIFEEAISLLGATVDKTDAPYDLLDHFYFTGAYFQGYNGQLGRATIQSDYLLNGIPVGSLARIQTCCEAGYGSVNADYGFALVRETPIPGASFLFLSAIAALSGRKLLSVR